MKISVFVSCLCFLAYNKKNENIKGKKGIAERKRTVLLDIPKPKIMEQIRKPGSEKSILYTISMTMMHPPATIKCLGEEKTICNLPTEKQVISFLSP